jgi:saccharopine dehydrogenase-like NADP-dependent oxidoreductase
MMKVMLLGAYGNFGKRIARGLSGHPQIELVLAGRDPHRLQDLFSQVGGERNHIHTLRVDTELDDIPQILIDQQIGLVIHTAGPFQEQGYQVARAAASAGAHYIDLADGRDFVSFFADALNGTFVQANRVAVTGASSVPALSSTVINYLTQGWKQIETIDVCIAPAQQSPRGLATLAGVLNYCGTPIEVWEEGKWIEKLGWAKPSWVHFAGMKPRLAALCDVPDLALFPKYYSGIRSVSFRAALELPILQRAFAVMANLRSWKLLNKPERYANCLWHMAKWFDRWGSDVGGMVVQVSGQKADGQTLTRNWHITAGNNDGPEIPCMAAIILAKRLASGEQIQSGARPCIGLIQLSEFEYLFDLWDMQTQVDVF